jgi:hypothetical protein
MNKTALRTLTERHECLKPVDEDLRLEAAITAAIRGTAERAIEGAPPR